MSVFNIEEMKKYRKENFTLRKEREYSRLDKEHVFTFFVSGNGHQFSAVTLMGKEELQMFADMVNKQLEEL